MPPVPSSLCAEINHVFEMLPPRRKLVLFKIHTKRMFLLALVPHFVRAVSSFNEECSGALVEVRYEDLITDSPSAASAVASAFKRGGLGIIAVRGIPDELVEARRELLYMSRSLALLAPSTLAKYERPENNFVVGWSRGREKFRGKLDSAKGSFYANALYSDPADGDERLESKYPDSTAEPIWPDADLGTNMSGCFRDVSRRLYEAAGHVLRHADLVVAEELAKKKRKFRAFWRRRSRLDEIAEKSRLHVSRLLHYYPLAERGSEWCGWHNDNSLVTALLPALFFNDETGDEIDAPEGAGLAVSANGNQTLLRLPGPEEDVILFQIGEAAQVLSGGALVATPHAVIAGESNSQTSRDSFAVFVEPNWDEMLRPPPGRGLNDVYAKDYATDLIPPLEKRLRKVPVEFAQFLADSVKEYY